MSLGQRIRELRQSKGLTQRQLAGEEISASFISLLEHDRVRPSVDTLSVIARRLGTSVDALLGQEGRVHEFVMSGMLALSQEAIRRRDYQTAARILDSAEYLTDTYRSELHTEVLVQRGQLALEMREYAAAETILEQARVECEEASNRWVLGRTLANIGRLKLRTREFRAAERALLAALETLRRARASRDPVRVEALITLGICYIYMGDFEKALRQYELAAESDVAKRDTVIRGRALWGLGTTHSRLGDLPRARTYLIRARDAFEQAEELPDLSRVLHNLAQLYQREGRLRDALRLYYQALRAMERLQYPDKTAVLVDIATLHLATGSLDDAEDFADRAWEEARRLQDPVATADAVVLRAKVSLVQGKTEGIVNAVSGALEEYRERGMLSAFEKTSKELGLLMQKRGMESDALRFLSQAAASEVTQPAPTAGLVQKKHKARRNR